MIEGQANVCSEQQKGKFVAFMRRKNTTTELLKGYIAQSLLILMRKKAFSKISIEEITKKAGVNRSTYYRNFKSKEDILRFYFYNISAEYKLKFEKTLSYKKHIQKLLTHYLKYKKELLSIYKNGVAYIIIDVLNDFFLKMPENQNISSEKLYRIYYNIGGIYNTFLLWFSNEMEDGPENMSEFYNSIISTSVDRDLLTKPFF